MITLSRSILEVIGNTPLLEITIDGVTFFAKLEMFNPGGSIKDRVALSIVEDAESKGLLKKGKRVIEATSGNTGIGLALVCAAKGYGCTIVMPENMSEERKKILKAYGAELILTPASEGIPGAIKEVERRLSENPDLYFPARQFENPANVKAHYDGTSVEILRQIGEIPGSFVAGVGTGGTLTGIGKRFKEINPDAVIVAVEPVESAVISGGKPGVHKIQGIGAGFIPATLDREVISFPVAVSFEEAQYYCRKLAAESGILVGISSGANVAAIVKAFKEGRLKTPVVTVFPDSGERYLSTELFL
ncbi:cysteine synthase A [Desulfurobacterium sp.]